MKDKYDRAIEYLKKRPDEIESAWLEMYSPMETDHPAHCLFQYATATGRSTGESICGCLTQIRQKGIIQVLDRRGRPLRRLTKTIRADDRLPANVGDVTVSDLPVFAEWQRRLDKEIRGVK